MNAPIAEPTVKRPSSKGSNDGPDDIERLPTQARILRVCYIANTGQEIPWHDGSTRYRCFYPAEHLRSQGIYSGIVPLRDLNESDLPDADVYIFHRPPFNQIVQRVTALLNQKGKILFADYDDLIFGVRNTRFSSQFEKGRDLISLSALFSENARALRLFKNVTVSTPTLAEHVKATHPSANVTVVRNGFPPKVLNHGWNCLKKKRLEKHALGYFPGTRTHDRDFLTWAEDIGRRDGDVPLHITGELSPEVYQNIKGVTYSPGGSFMSMFMKMTNVSIALAPLSRNNFNSSKSNIKAIESFLVGCYALATELNDTSVLVEQGAEIGILKDEGLTLIDHINLIVEKPIISFRNAELAQQKYCTANVCRDLVSILDESVGSA